MRRFVLAAITAASLLGGTAHAAAPVFGVAASSASSETILFDIDYAGLFTGMVFAEASEYDVHSVTVNGVSLADMVGDEADFFEFSFDVTPGTMSIAITGLSVGGGNVYTSYEVTPVPEAGSVAMALAGLGVVGVLAARRRRAA